MNFGFFLFLMSFVYVSCIAIVLGWGSLGSGGTVSSGTIILSIIIGVIAFILAWPREISSSVGEEDRNEPKKPC